MVGTGEHKSQGQREHEGACAGSMQRINAGGAGAHAGGGTEGRGGGGRQRDVDARHRPGRLGQQQALGAVGGWSVVEVVVVVVVRRRAGHEGSRGRGGVRPAGGGRRGGSVARETFDRGGVACRAEQAEAAERVRGPAA